MDRQWHFETLNSEDRDEWVTHIDRAIFSRLQLLESSSKGFSAVNSGGGGEGYNWNLGSAESDPSGGVNLGNYGGGGLGSLAAGQDVPGNITGGVDEAMAKIIRTVSGNDICADCGAPG